jgi:signal transduction histidine kinase
MANEEVTDDQLFRFYDLMFRAQIRLQNDAYQISDLVDKMNGIIDRTEPDSLRQNYSFKIAQNYYNSKQNAITDSILRNLMNATDAASPQMFNFKLLRAINLLEMHGPSYTDSARILLHEAEKIARALNNDKMLQTVTGNLATTHQFEGRYDRALEIYQQLLPDIIDNDIYTANTLYRIALIQWNIGEMEEALSTSRRALAITERVHLDRLELDILYLLYQQLIESGRLEDAIETVERLRTKERQIDSDKIAKEIAEIESYLELETRKRTITLLEKAREGDRVILILLVLIAVILTVTSIVIWRGLRSMKRFNQILSKQKNHLEEVIATKNKIFSVIGHDLRGPVGNIYMFLDVMNGADELSDTERKHIRSRMMVSAEKSLQLLENLLFWGREELKDLNPEYSKIAAKPLLNRVIDLLSFQAEMKSVDIHQEINSDLSLRTDERMIALIVRNVLSNAIKFTRKNGKVTIKAYQKEENVVITITDNGKGMSDEEQRRLLSSERFKSDGTEGERGYGVGMYLAKSFTRQLNGQMNVYSKPGKETTFMFTFQSA